MGCDGTVPPTGVMPASAVCSDGSWTPIADLGVHAADPRNLLLAGDTFYYTSDDNIMSVSVGGSPIALSSGPAFWMWLDGQAIDFVYDTDQLQQIPLTGGPPTMVADGMTIGVAPDDAVAGGFAFDGQYLYWDLHSPAGSSAGWSAWRMPAAGGAATKLADLPPPAAGQGNEHTLTPTPEGLLVAAARFPDVVAYLVPPSGGSPAMLPVPPVDGVSFASVDSFMGAGSNGIVWLTSGATSTVSITDLTDPTTPVWRSLWTDLPPTLSTSQLWAYPGGDDGSWIIGGFERFGDGQQHVSLWSVDAAGNGVRLGCNPNPDFTGVLSAVLPTPTAVYTIAAAGNTASGAYDFSLVRLAR